MKIWQNGEEIEVDEIPKNEKCGLFFTCKDGHQIKVTLHRGMQSIVDMMRDARPKNLTPLIPRAPKG